MLLEKNNFLSLPEVSDFSEWLSEVSEKLRVGLKVKKSRFVENAIETNWSFSNRITVYERNINCQHWQKVTS